MNHTAQLGKSLDCQSCGACCVEAGKVVLTGIEEVEAIPKPLVENQRGHLCIAKHMGGRCKALEGVIGKSVNCSIYEIRPAICRKFPPGSDACLEARARANRKLNSELRPRGYGEDWESTI